MDTDRAREILGVSISDGDEELEAAYRQKVKTHHPDVTDDPEAAGKFRKVQEAKETLEQFRQRERTGDRAGSGDSGQRRQRQRPDWADAGRGQTDRRSRTEQTARASESDSQWSERSRSTPGQADQWVNRERDERAADGEWQYESATSRHGASWTADGVSGSGSRSAARRRERTRNRTGRSRSRGSEDQAAATDQAGTTADDAEQTNGPLVVRMGYAAGIGSMVYLAFLLALVGTASLLPMATAVTFVAGLGGLAWAGSRYPLSTTGTTGLLGLSAVGVLPVGPVYSLSGTMPGIASYSPLGIDMLLALPIIATAAGIAYGTAVRDGERSTDQSQ
ncbi:J domain-containing protein [Haloarcula salinisoli]|uniref:DnaJ domain-containing protein n=1 Tax=Haloarcula salinisoli TaxID=2487746 RepID=A0A8J7YDV6_9EURY|nr:J domain-containing protein [Halomicroarcula salinisoli]MBX0304085.1 DnaJ domain-containing protein [Halomicroarcula salinisoli]